MGGVVVSVKESKTARLRHLESEARRLDRVTKDEARQKIETWIAEPTMAKIKERLVDDLDALRTELEVERKFSQGIASWIKTTLGTQGEVLVQQRHEDLLLLKKHLDEEREKHYTEQRQKRDEK